MLTNILKRQKPWDLIKTDKEQCAYALRSLVASLRIVSLLLVPFTPTVAEKDIF